jgi:hypothetical protein
MEHFVLGSTVRTATNPIGIHRNTATSYFRRFRDAAKIEDESPVNCL